VADRPEGQLDDPLKEALAEYLSIPGMQAALLVSDQGLLISRAARDGVDTASIAALAIDTVSTVQQFGLQVEAGYLDAMRIEFDKLTVVLAPFAPDVMLALVADAGSLGAMSGDLTPGRGAPSVPFTPSPADQTKD
jgi:predicted regulator of Ras-like GTPase activity (Roadblock/LC7/MglB family)